MTVLVALGLSALIVASPQAFLSLKFAGAAYLLWLAVQAIRHGSSLSLPSRPAAPDTLLRSWLAGLTINLLNPKIVLFLMTFLPQFVTPGDAGADAQLLTFGLLFMLISLPITVGMILAAGAVATTLRERPSVSRAIDWIFASVFTAFAAQIVWSRGN